MARIVIIDDSPVIRKILNKLLVDQGHQIVAMGKNGLEAIDLCREHSPELMFLDITMPQMGGRESLQVIINENPSAKIIMFSSVGDGVAQQECLEIGARAFIEKSSNMMGEDLAKKIQNTINKVLAA